MVPCSSSQIKGSLLQVYLFRLQHCQETIQSISQHLPAILLHADLLPMHLGDSQSFSKRNNSSCQWNGRYQMSDGLQSCPCCQRIPLTLVMQMIRVMICCPRALLMENPQSACCKSAISVKQTKFS